MIDSELCPVCKTNVIMCSVFAEEKPILSKDVLHVSCISEHKHGFMCKDCAIKAKEILSSTHLVYIYDKKLTPENYQSKKLEALKSFVEKNKKKDSLFLDIDWDKTREKRELSDELKDKYFIATSTDSELSKLLKNSIRDLTEALEDLKKGDTIAWAKTIDVLSELKKLDSISPDREMEFMGLYRPIYILN